MARLTYDDLYQVPLKDLGSAADDWKEMVDQLAQLATAARDGMVRKSEVARWEGVNAGVTRPFIRTTAEEFHDAHTQAKGIWSMLRDAHRDLTEIQKSLKRAIDVDAKKHSIQVSSDADGGVICKYVDRSGEQTKDTAAQTAYLQNFADRVASLVAQATEIDGSVTRALGKIHGNDSHDFGHATYESLDDVQRERTVQLAKKSLSLHESGEELSPTELAEFRTLMQGNAKDREFAVEFYRDMGAKDALRFEAQLAINASSGDDKTRLELARSIQKDMGIALATATDPPSGKDNPHTSFREDRTYLGKAWINELKKVGLQPLGVGLDHGEPVGYQALASLLRYGTYDKAFLNPIAEELVKQEREGATWPVPNPHNGDLHFGLNLADEKSPGWDPMTGVLTAFGNSPDASTAFFNGSTGGGNSGLKRLDNLEFFLSDENGRKEWLPDKTSGLTDPDDASRVPAKQALGEALQSATTGRPYGDEGPLKPHTRAQADVFEGVVKEVGGNPGSVKHDGELAAIAPHLGNMSAEYMYDIQRTFAGGDSSGYFDHAGAAADLNSAEAGQLKQFLQATAEDPKAYGAIMNSQQAVTTEAVRGAMADPGSETLAAVTERAARPGGQIAGCTAEGQADSIAAADNSTQKVQDYNKNLEEGDKWIGRIAEMAANHIPVAGDAVNWLTEDIREGALEHYKRDEQEAVDQIEEDRENYLEGERTRAASAAKKAFLDAAKQQGISTEPGTPGAGAADDVYQAIISGHADGRF